MHIAQISNVVAKRFKSLACDLIGSPYLKSQFFGGRSDQSNPTSFKANV